MITLFTIGHSNHPQGHFVELLQPHRIETLVDVRSYPGSRKWPHFNREIMGKWLADGQIRYEWLPSLGGRRRPRKDSKNTAWRNLAFRGYADYMETDEFESGIAQLLKMASESTCSIMCAETLWWQCHRSLISDHLKALGHQVLHIRGDSSVQEHPFSSAARFAEGKLTYESEQGEFELRA